jgi:hypothetical protein
MGRGEYARTGVASGRLLWPDVWALAFLGEKKTKNGRNEITSLFGLYKQRNGRTSTEKKQNRKTDYTELNKSRPRLRERTAPMADGERTMVLFDLKSKLYH